MLNTNAGSCTVQPSTDTGNVMKMRKVPSTALDLKVVQSLNSSASRSHLHSQWFHDCFPEERKKIYFSSSGSLLSSVQGLDSEKRTDRQRCCSSRHSSPCCHYNFLCWPAVSYKDRRGRPNENMCQYALQNTSSLLRKEEMHAWFLWCFKIC